MVVSPMEEAEVACQQDACEDAGLLQPSPVRSRCRGVMTVRAAVVSALAMLSASFGLCLWLSSAHQVEVVLHPQQQVLPELAGAAPVVSLEELHPEPVEPVEPLPHQTAVSASDDYTLKVWDLSSGQCLRTLRGHENNVKAVAVDFVRKRALSASEDNTMKVWELTTGQCLRTLQGHKAYVSAVAADFAQQRAVSASIDYTLKVWDLATGQCLRTLRGHRNPVLGVAADFVRKRAVSASGDETLKVWDLATGQCLKTLRGHKHMVLAVAADFARQRAVSGSDDKTLKVWDLASGQCLKTLQGHYASVNAVAADFARQRAVSASHDETLKVWDLATGQCLRTLRGHRNAVRGVAADFVRKRAVSASIDRTLKVWDLATGQCLRTLHEHDSDSALLGCVNGVAADWAVPGLAVPFKFDCLARAEMSWLPRQLVNLAPSEKREYSEELVSKATLTADSWGSSQKSQKSQRGVSAAHHSARRLAGEATIPSATAATTARARAVTEAAGEEAAGPAVRRASATSHQPTTAPGGSHSSQRRQRNVSAGEAASAARAARVQAAAETAGEAAIGAESVAELFGGAGAAGACALTGPEGTALAPLCAGLGQEAGKHLAKLFEAKGEKEHTEEEETKSHEEGYKTSRRSVTGQSKRCTHSLHAREEPVHLQAWQRRISLTYTHQIFAGRNRSITIDLDIPGVDLVPTGQTPGKEYGTLPKAPESGCYSKTATDTISAIIKGGCV